MTDKKNGFQIHYHQPDGSLRETLHVCPVPLRGKHGKLSDVVQLQEQLIHDFVECDGRLGNLLCRDSTWNTMQKLAAMLPVVGKPTPGFDIEELAAASDFAQLGRIFFSESIKDDLERETDADGNVTNKPSLIAKIHDLNFSGSLFKAIREREEKQQSERMQKLEKTLLELDQSPPPVTAKQTS